MKYKHLFFDLDGTLWDLYRNTRESFTLLFPQFEELEYSPASFEDFVKRYFHHNEIVWKLYREDKIEKSVLRTIRFRRTFDDLGWKANDDLVLKFADAFIDTCPRQPHLVNGTIELLDTFHGKIPMHIITNGFKEVQDVKLNSGKIKDYFIHVINSEDCGVRKPNKGIFDHALALSGADPSESLMIGDDWEADILGARDAGMDTAWIGDKSARHNYKPHYWVSDMKEMKDLLLGIS